MTSIIRLLACLLLLAFPKIAGAGIYNNAGTATREDSIAAFFQALDSLGNPVDLASGDSVYVISFGPGGWVAFKDSMAYNNARIIGNDWEDYAGGQVYTMKYAIADMDGDGVNGTYRYVIIVDDNTGANLQTSTWGEFQLYTTNDISAKWDSTTQIPTGEITTGSFTSGAINAAAIASSAIDFGVELDTGGLGASGWAHGTKILTALDEDNTTIDLNGSAVGSITTVTNIVNGGAIDVASGNASINWGDVSNPTTMVGLTNTTISSSQTVDLGSSTGEVFVATDGIESGDIGTGAITSTAIADGAITDAEIADGAIDWGGELDTTGFGLGVRSAWRDTLTTIVTQLAALLTDTSQSLSANDSALVSRIVGRKVWGTAGANGSAGSDSTASGTHNVRVLHWAGSAATDTVRASDSGGYAYPHVDLRNWVGRTPSPLSTEGYVDGALQTIMDEPFAIVNNGATEYAMEVALMDDAIDANKVFGNAIGSSELATSAVQEIVNYVWAMKNDTTGAIWEAGGDTSMGALLARINSGIKALRDSSDEMASTGAAGSIPDSLAAFIARMGNYFYADSEWAATGSACGDGPQTDSILVLDTSGVDAAVPGVWVGVTDAAGNQWHTFTNGNGWAVLSLAYSTIYSQAAFNAGHYFKPEVDTTGSDGSEVDTIFGYDLSITAPSAANLGRVYVYVQNGGKYISGVKLVCQLDPVDSITNEMVNFDTSTGVVYVPGVPVSDTGMITNANGFAKADLPLTTFISPFGARWAIHLEYLGQPITPTVYITLTSTTPVCLQSALGLGSCP